MSNAKINFKHILIEAILIVFTVSLALALSEWRQQIKTANLVERVLVTLEDEMRKNIVSLEKTIVYHEKLVKDLRAGRHVMVGLPLDSLPFNPRNNDELLSFIKQSIVASTSTYVEPIEIIYINNQRFLRLDQSVNEVVLTSDSIFVYGSSNIILRSADVSINSWQIAQATNSLIEMDYEMIKMLGETTSSVEVYQQTSEKALELLYGNGSGITSALEDMFWMEKDLMQKCEGILNYLKEES